MSFYVELNNLVQTVASTALCRTVAFDKDTDVATLLPGPGIACHKIVCLPEQEEWEPNPRTVDRKRHDGRIILAATFNEVVDPTPLLEAFATPMRVKEDAADTDAPYSIVLSRVNSEWRPTQGSAFGTSVSLTLTFRRL